MTISNNEHERRTLVQRLSRAAALIDRTLAGEPRDPARGIDYVARRRRHEREAAAELAALASMLTETK